MYKLQFFTFIFAVLLQQKILKFINRRILLAVAYPTKKKTRCLGSPVQKLGRGSKNLKSRSHDPGHTILGGQSDITRCGLSNKEKTKSLLSPVQKLQRGFQNLKSRSRDPGHAPLGGHSSPIG